VVAALSRGGATQFVVTGLAGASDVALDSATGEVWVTVETAGTVVRLAPDGRILRQLGGFDTPDGIALDPGTGAGPRPAGPTRRAKPRS
jgi:DNA-binding beta-propeller fold protein YncE